MLRRAYDNSLGAAGPCRQEMCFSILKTSVSLPKVAEGYGLTFSLSQQIYSSRQALVPIEGERPVAEGGQQ